MWHTELESLNLNNEDWSWVSFRGSLTKLLVKEAGLEKLKIQLLQQGWRSSSHEEKNRMNIDTNEKLFDRKIIMTVMNRPWMYAQSYFSKQATTLFGDKLINLADKSLGLLIENFSPVIKRGKIEYAFIDSTNKMFASIIRELEHSKLSIQTRNNILSDKLIIRRSLFYLSEQPQISPLFNISEVFLPDLVNKMLRLEVHS